jgi:hypothetical protein
MILSLLYRLSPDELQADHDRPEDAGTLSIYDGIPHLLSPVVTDPIESRFVALKWTVRADGGPLSPHVEGRCPQPCEGLQRDAFPARNQRASS